MVAVIRAATTDDAAALSRLSTQLGYPGTAKELAARLGSLLSRPAEHAVLVASDARHAVIGWVHVGIRELLESPTRGEILGLVVDRAARRGGVGRALVAAAEQWVRGREVGEIVVRSNTVREESHPFYERLGYRRIKSQHVYHRALPVSGDAGRTDV